MKRILLLSVILLTSLLAACSSTDSTQTAIAKAAPPSATSVVTAYLRIFNAGMKSGDFSKLDSVYSSSATLVQSNPKGVTTVVHGLAAITKFYQGLRQKFPGFQWTVDSMRNLAPDVVLAYQHAGSPPLKVAGRCIHVFVVDDGKITRYDWATFYPGQ